MKPKSSKPEEEKRFEEEVNEEKIVKLVMFSLDQEIYGIEIEQVVEINRTLEITPVPNSPEYIEGLIDLRGEVIAIIDPEKRFGLKRETPISKKHTIVCQSAEAKFGLLVDQVFKIINLPLNAVNKAPDLLKTKIKEKFVKGVGILNDRVFVILDASKIVTSEEIEGVKISEGVNKNEDSNQKRSNN